MEFVKLIVVGDPHINAPADDGQLNLSSRYLNQAIAHINQHHNDAALCLFIGDLAHDGDSAEYAQFNKLLAPLTVPHALMVGNHDNRENFSAEFTNAPKDPNGFIQFVVDLGPSYRLIALDSLNAPPYNSFRHLGKLCPERLAFLENSLQTAGERKIIVAMHHQPFQIGLPGMDVIRLWNGDEYLALLSQYPNVEMLLMGHNHRAISGVSHGYPFTCFKALSPQTPLDFESLDPTGTIVEPPSYGVLLLTADGIIAHQEDFAAGVTRHSNWDKQDPAITEGWQFFVKTMLPDHS